MATNLKITQHALAKLIPYARNARTHSPEQVQNIADSIARFGFLNPVLIDPTGEIIAGHGRALAAELLGMDKVPVIVVGHLSDGEKRALRLADNRIAEKSTWDNDTLRKELEELRSLDISMEGIGFSDTEMDALMQVAGSLLPDEPYQPPTRIDGSDHTEDDEGADESDTNEPKEQKPSARDDDYSVFELVMLHENKLRLVEVLSEIRAEKLYDKLEEALMCMVRHYKGEPIE